MAARIAYSTAFVSRRLRAQRRAAGANQQGLQPLLLMSRTLAVFGCAAMVATASNAVLLGGAGQLSSSCRPLWGSFLKAGALHVAVGGACLAACAVGVLRTERGLFRALKEARKGHAD